MRRNGPLPALGIVLAVGSLAATPEITLLTREVSLGKVRPDLMVVLESVTVSADSNRVAYAARRGPKQLVVVDGVEGKEYDEIAKRTPVFSPDSRRVGYVARRGGWREGKQVVVLDRRGRKGICCRRHW